MKLSDRVERIVGILDRKKAEDIEVFGLENADYIARKVIICNSLGGKHTQALFDALKEELKPAGENFVSSDESDKWIVIDLGDILIHIMTPEYRNRYSIEEFLEELIRS